MGAPDTGLAEPLLAVRGIEKVYPVNATAPVHAVREVSLEVAPGEFVMITGRSGSGKTTLLNLVAGLVTPTSGSVVLDGTDLWSISDRERSRMRNDKIGFVFQFPSLIPTLTVLENTRLPLAFAPRRRGPSPKADRALELLELVGLADKAQAFPRQLSAGQQQRVVLARSLVREPCLILADEPTSNLDELTEQEIMELFRSIHRLTGVTILMVTHSAQLVSWGTRSITMRAGSVEADEGHSHTGALTPRSDSRPPSTSSC